MRRIRPTLGKYTRALLSMTPRERLHFYSMPEPNSGCRLWLMSVGSHGYGTLQVDGVEWLAHRLAWTLSNGPIPHGMEVCHKCDVRPCIEDNHLFLGTRADNVSDMVRKGRGSRGEDHTSAKLTAAQVRDLRTEIGTHTSLEPKYGISRTNISLVRRGIAYRSVE